MFSAEMNEAGNYHVEVSGWDSSEKFFVEKTVLHWDGCAEKHVRLSRALRDGCVVFVRLLLPSESCENLPIAYRAEIVPPGAVAAPTSVRLVQLHPSAPAKDVTEKYVPSESLVA